MLASQPEAEDRPVEFHIALTGTRPDLPTLRALLENADPGAVADCDELGQNLRVSTDLSRHDLREVASQAGLDFSDAQIRPQPSVCCGGCGG